MRNVLIALAFCVSGCGQISSQNTVAELALDVATPPINRCMNLGSALEASFEGEWGYVVRRADLVRLKEAGFDTVRLPVRWSAHTGASAPFDIDPDLFARVDEIVSWAEEIGLKIIVNVHHFDALNEDPDTHEPRLEAIWDQIATHYAGASEHLIFETLNEPHTNMTIERTDIMNRRLLDRIRADHPDRWIILGTAFWGNLSGLEASDPPYDPRAMLTYHEYSPFEFTHQGASWADAKDTGIRWGTRKDVAEMLTELDKAVMVQNRKGMPVFVGEFGVYQGVPMEQRARWTRTLRQGMEARGLAWCHWDYAGSLNVYDVEREAWLPDLKAALLD